MNSPARSIFDVVNETSISLGMRETMLFPKEREAFVNVAEFGGSGVTMVSTAVAGTMSADPHLELTDRTISD
jgi:hypothetical protein